MDPKHPYISILTNKYYLYFEFHNETKIKENKMTPHGYKIIKEGYAPISLLFLIPTYLFLNVFSPTNNKVDLLLYSIVNFFFLNLFFLAPPPFC
jgi:hypothetical protein